MSDSLTFQLLAIESANSTLVAEALTKGRPYWKRVLDEEDVGNTGLDAALRAGRFDLLWMFAPTYSLGFRTVSVYAALPPPDASKFTLLNCFRDNSPLTSNDGLLDVVTRAYGSKEGAFEVMPASYVLDGGVDASVGAPAWKEFMREYTLVSNGLTDTVRLPPKHCARGLWLLKPCDGRDAHGVRIFSDISHMRSFLWSARGKWVAQKYLESPLLLAGRKFVVRVPVLVTDSGFAYVNKDPYVHTASTDFTLDTPAKPNEDTDFVTAHITTPALQHLHPAFGSREPENVLYLDTVQRYLNTYSDFPVDSVDSVVVPRIKRIVADVVSVALADMVDMQGGQRCFELMAADFVLDDTLKPYLIGFTSNPDMAIPTTQHQEYASALYDDVMSLAVAPLFPPSPTMKTLWANLPSSAAASQFLPASSASVPLSPSVRGSSSSGSADTTAPRKPSRFQMICRPDDASFGAGAGSSRASHKLTAVATGDAVVGTSGLSWWVDSMGLKDDDVATVQRRELVAGAKKEAEDRRRAAEDRKKRKNNNNNNNNAVNTSTHHRKPGGRRGGRDRDGGGPGAGPGSGSGTGRRRRSPERRGRSPPKSSRQLARSPVSPIQASPARPGDRPSGGGGGDGRVGSTRLTPQAPRGAPSKRGSVLVVSKASLRAIDDAARKHSQATIATMDGSVGVTPRSRSGSPSGRSGSRSPGLSGGGGGGGGGVGGRGRSMPWEKVGPARASPTRQAPFSPVSLLPSSPESTASGASVPRYLRPTAASSSRSAGVAPPTPPTSHLHSDLSGLSSGGRGRTGGRSRSRSPVRRRRDRDWPRSGTDKKNQQPPQPRASGGVRSPLAPRTPQMSASPATPLAATPASSPSPFKLNKAKLSFAKAAAAVMASVRAASPMRTPTGRLKAAARRAEQLLVQWETEHAEEAREALADVPRLPKGSDLTHDSLMLWSSSVLQRWCNVGETGKEAEAEVATATATATVINGTPVSAIERPVFYTGGDVSGDVSGETADKQKKDIDTDGPSVEPDCPAATTTNTSATPPPAGSDAATTPDDTNKSDVESVGSGVEAAPNVWVEVPGDRPYFYNSVTRATVWKRPPEDDVVIIRHDQLVV